METLADQHRLALETANGSASPKVTTKGSKRSVAANPSKPTKTSSKSSSSSSSSSATLASTSTTSSRNSKRSSSSLGTSSDRPLSSSGGGGGGDISPSPTIIGGVTSGSNEEKSLLTSLPPSSIPLHIVLRDVIRKVGDVERLHAAGITLSSAFTFKGAEQSRHIGPASDSMEFLYGAPVGALHKMSDELYESDDDDNTARSKANTNTTTSAAASPSDDTPPANDDSKRTSSASSSDKKGPNKVSSATAATATGGTTKRIVADKKLDEKKADTGRRATSNSGNEDNKEKKESSTSVSGGSTSNKGRVSSASSKKDKEVKITLADKLQADAKLAADIVTRGPSSLINDIKQLSMNDARFRDISVITVSLPAPPVILPSVGQTASNTNINVDATNDDVMMSPKSLNPPSSPSSSMVPPRSPKTPSSGDKKDALTASSPSVSGSKKESKTTKSSIGGKGKGGKRTNDDDNTAVLAQAATDAISSIAQEIVMQLRYTSGQIADYGVWRRDARVVELPTSLQTLHADTRLYTALMDKIDNANVTVPLLLHCLFEQVSANTLPNEASLSVFNDDKADGLDSYIDKAFERVQASVIAGRPLDEPRSHSQVSHITSATQAGGVRQVDKNGHIWLHARCISCGDLQPLADELANVTPMSLASMLPATHYCPATVGASHRWDNGTCTSCGSRQPISPADRVAHLAKFCPVTIGNGMYLRPRALPFLLTRLP
jgi:hypothetical protein